MKIFVNVEEFVTLIKDALDARKLTLSKYTCLVLLGCFSLAASAQTATVAAAARPAQKIVSSSTEPNWRPTPLQQITVELLSTNYFSLRDSGQFDEAYAQFSPSLKIHLPLESYRSIAQKFNGDAGKVQARQITALTWYNNAPRAGSGLRVAVDYRSQFPNLSLHCGYLVWQEQVDGSFLMSREEANVIDNNAMANLKPGEFEKLRVQFNC